MIKKVMIWYLMLNKRLLKKTGFLIILLLIPVLAFLMNYFIEKEDSGLLHVALAAEDVDDEFANNLIRDLDIDSELFIFTSCKSEEEAKQMVKTSNADAAWIIASDIETKLQEVVEGKSRELVKVYETEENVILKISRERIFGVLFPHLSYFLYEDFVINDVPEDVYISQEELEENYRIFAVDESIVDFEFLNSSQSDISSAKFLASPIRGLLVVIMLLSGVAATMYFLQDEKRGTFSWLPENKGYFVLFGNNIAALSLSGLFVTIALILADAYTSLLIETLAMILLIIVTAAFCSVLGAVFKTVNSMGIMIPTLMVIAVVFCPVFFNTHMPGQEILPPYLYLYGINDKSYLFGMLVYCIIMIPLGYILYGLFRKKRILVKK